MVRLPPIRTGPSVSAAQYTSTPCSSGRGRATRQIWLKARSMVAISITAVIARNTMPTALSRPAFSANCVT
jgi:hypothetical protein